MKNKIALAAAFMAATSFSTAEIVINDFLSFEGFADMSYTHTDQDSDTTGKASSNSYGIDQVEISWLFDFDPVTAQIDLAYEGSDSQRIGPDGGEVEQAFATYHMDSGSAITAGRFASMLGFEAFEPTGLYQYSFAYFAVEDAGSPFATDTGMLPLYDQGVKYTYETDTTFAGISLVDSSNINRLGGSNGGDFAIEAAGALDFENGLSWFVGGRYTSDGGTNVTIPGAFTGTGATTTMVADDQYTLNTYLTYETGAWIFAGELAYTETDFVGGTDLDTLQALLMANFAYSEQASVTGRLSYLESDGGNADEDFFKYTLAHGYAFTDNLFLVNEISYVDGEDLGNQDFDQTTVVAELIFSF